MDTYLNESYKKQKGTKIARLTEMLIRSIPHDRQEMGVYTLSLKVHTLADLVEVPEIDMFVKQKGDP